MMYYKSAAVVIMTIFTIACAQQESDSQATNLKFDSTNNADGTYNYVYETSNKISGHESGVGGVSASGGVQWISKEGEPIELTYTADENGYHPEGSHIPAVPKHVVELLEWLKANPSDDDGSYKPQ